MKFRGVLAPIGDKIVNDGERTVTKKNEKYQFLALPVSDESLHIVGAARPLGVCVRPQTCIYAALVERSTEKIVKNFTTRTQN